MPSESKHTRKDGSVVYRLSFQNPDTGKQRRESFATRKEMEVRKKELDILIVAQKNGWITDTIIKKRWSDLKQMYFKYMRENNSVLTYKRVNDVFIAFDKYLGFSNPQISKITWRTIESFRNKRLDQGLSKATVALELRHLKAVFNYAVNKSCLRKNPVIGVKFPKNDINKVRYLTVKEIERLVESIKKRNDKEIERIVLAYLYTGARRSELLKPNLTWDDIDFNKRQMLLRGKGKRNRYIPLNDTLLNQFLKMNKEDREYPFLYTPDYYSHKIHEYYNLAGIAGANLHSLRKTFGSLLMQYNKTDIYTVSKLLGHSSITVTEKYYVDLLDENLRRPVAELENLF